MLTSAEDRSNDQQVIHVEEKEDTKHQQANLQKEQFEEQLEENIEWKKREENLEKQTDDQSEKCQEIEMILHAEEEYADQKIIWEDEKQKEDLNDFTEIQLKKELNGQKQTESIEYEKNCENNQKQLKTKNIEREQKQQRERGRIWERIEELCEKARIIRVRDGDGQKDKVKYKKGSIDDIKGGEKQITKENTVKSQSKQKELVQNQKSILKEELNKIIEKRTLFPTKLYEYWLVQQGVIKGKKPFLEFEISIFTKRPIDFYFSDDYTSK